MDDGLGHHGRSFELGSLGIGMANGEDWVDAGTTEQGAWHFGLTANDY